MHHRHVRVEGEVIEERHLVRAGMKKADANRTRQRDARYRCTTGGGIEQIKCEADPRLRHSGRLRQRDFCGGID